MKKENKYNLPSLTQETILYVDSTPNNEYPLRILKAYRENCNSKWSGNSDNPIFEIMNKHQDQRAKILDKTIEILEKELNE